MKKVKVIDIIEDIRSLIKLTPQPKKAWLTKEEFKKCLEYLDLSLPHGNMHIQAYELLKDKGWQMSTTLITMQNAEILKKMIKEKGTERVKKMITPETKVEEKQAPLFLPEKTMWEKKREAYNQQFVDKKTVEESFPQGEVEEQLKADKDLLRAQILQQYLKSAMRNLDLIEEIHFIKGTLIEIRVKE